MFKKTINFFKSTNNRLKSIDSKLTYLVAHHKISNGNWDLKDLTLEEQNVIINDNTHKWEDGRLGASEEHAKVAKMQAEILCYGDCNSQP